MRDSLGDEKALFGFKVIRVNFDWSDIIFYSRYKQQQINFCGYNREEIVQELESTMFRYPDPPFNPWAD
jgi:hypothetical protein